MMKKLVLTGILCMTLLSLSYTNVKAEEGIAGISVVLENATIEEIKSAYNNTYMFTTDYLNFRSKPSLDSDIILTLEKRTKVRKISSCGDWTKIEYDNQIGYVYSEYLRDTELFTSDKNRWGIELTDNEIDLLAKIVWGEARGESNIGKMAISETIFNRMVAMQFPDTLEEVLSQGDHFATWDDRNNAEPTEEIYNCIDKVLNNETSILTVDTVYFGTEPRNDNITAHIGGHWFCAEDD